MTLVVMLSLPLVWESGLSDVLTVSISAEHFWLPETLRNP
jgi:hypothetical protein